MKKASANPSHIIGILALQGSFAEHMAMLVRIGVPAKLIRSRADTKNITACIIPGGESTTMMQMLKSTGLDQWLIASAKAGMPMYGACAGMIVLANLGLIDIQINRNAYGPQLYSFEDAVSFRANAVSRGISSMLGIFIRAPRVLSASPKVQILAKHGRDPVLVRQKNILAGSFHPELTQNTSIHEYFCGM